MINFLFKILDKRGKDTSILFNNIDFKEQKISIIKRLIDDYSDKFDFNMINSTLAKTTIELTGEFTKEKEKYEILFDEMKRTFSEQKNEIISMKIEQEKRIKSIEEKYQKRIIEMDDEIKKLKMQNTKQMNSLKSQFENMIEINSKIVKESKIEQISKIVFNMINIQQIKELDEKSQTIFINEIINNENQYINENKNKSLIHKIILIHHLFQNVTSNNKDIPSEINFLLENLEQPTIKYEYIQKIYLNNNLKPFLEKLNENFDNYLIELESPSENFDSIMDIFNSIDERYPSITQKTIIYVNIMSSSTTNSNENNANPICTFKIKYLEIKEKELNEIFDIFSDKLNQRKFEFQQCSLLHKMSIQYSISSIFKEMFYNCSSLTEISIPSSVTSIEQSVFEKCTKLKRITIPASIKTIGERAFYECQSLEQITIPSSVTIIEKEAFYYCSSLEHISIESSSITTIKDRTFLGCSKLKQIKIPSSVAEIGHSSFTGCSSLLQIEIPPSEN